MTPQVRNSLRTLAALGILTGNLAAGAVPPAEANTDCWACLKTSPGHSQCFVWEEWMPWNAYLDCIELEGNCYAWQWCTLIVDR